MSQQTDDMVGGLLLRMSAAVLCSTIHDYLHGAGERPACVLGDLKRESEIFIFDDKATRDDHGSFPWYCDFLGIDAEALKYALKSDGLSPAIKSAINQLGKDKFSPPRIVDMLRRELRNARKAIRNAAPRPGLGGSGLQ